jgi:phosphoribosylformylglycinamidine synthase I
LIDMKAAIILFPGTNRERDMAVALKRASGVEPAIIWHGDTDLPDGLDLIVLPGGFAHGDYLRCGAIAANASPIMPAVVAAANRGVPVMGVCNGFQMLTETGLLPGALMRNASLKFICRDVHLKVARNDTAFTSQYTPGEVIRVPVAHGDGNYFADETTLDALEAEGRVLFRYCDETGAETDDANPNGSQRNIAGILNEAGTVMGMMPHPEDLVDHALGGIGGLGLFESLSKAA